MSGVGVLGNHDGGSMASISASSWVRPRTFSQRSKIAEAERPAFPQSEHVPMNWLPGPFGLVRSMA